MFFQMRSDVVCPDPKKCLPHLGICEQKKGYYRCYLPGEWKRTFSLQHCFGRGKLLVLRKPNKNDAVFLLLLLTRLNGMMFPLHEQRSHSPYGLWCWFSKWCHQYLSRNFSHQVASYPKPSNLRSSAIIYVDPKVDHLSMFQMMFQLPDC